MKIKGSDSINSVADKKSLMEMSNEELLNAYRSVDSNTNYGAAHYREEILRRSQDKNTAALHRWNIVIAVATLVNTIAVIVQVFLSLNAK